MALANGQSRTCEITNNDQPASLTLLKTVEGGPADSSDFTPLVNGQPVSWAVAYPALPGQYTASEIAQVDNYVPGVWGGDCAADGTVSIALGAAQDLHDHELLRRAVHRQDLRAGHL